jgi:hypothetical protein
MMSQSTSNLLPCIECTHMLSNSADKCVKCGTRYPFGIKCDVCKTQAKSSEVVTHQEHGVYVNNYHITCKMSILTFPGKSLSCSDCNNVIGELKDEYLDNSKRTCKHCGSHRVFLYQGMPVEIVKKCQSCDLPIIAPLHQSHHSGQYIHEVCLPLYREQYSQLKEESSPLKLNREAENGARDYLSYKDDIDNVIRHIKAHIDEVNSLSRGRIEYWLDGNQAFVVRLLKRNGGDHHNRGIIFNFKGAYFEIVFWSHYEMEYFVSGGLYGTKKIRTGSITKPLVGSWLEWLHTGKKKPVRILDAAGRKSAKYARWCYILLAAFVIIVTFIAILKGEL